MTLFVIICIFYEQKYFIVGQFMICILKFFYIFTDHNKYVFF